MKLSLSKNISRLRKSNDMTQEQLAEALGVSFAAVSKWERGVATPELSMIAEMADLFCVSIDALIGYEFRNNDKDTVVQRLKGYVHDRETKEALTDVEKALQRYPNCFEIVYYSAVNYRVRGIYQQNPSYSKRALALYQHALRLIGHNADPEISELSISRAIADIHMALGEYDKGMEILKQHNPCRINHPLIGEMLASACNDPEGALPYLSTALMDLTVSQMQIVMGYLNLYNKTKDYQNAAGDRVEKAESRVSGQNGELVATLKDSLSGFQIIKSFNSRMCSYSTLPFGITSPCSTSSPKRRWTAPLNCPAYQN